jgi:hypothetical protein
MQILDHLDNDESAAVASHQPYWVARAHVLSRQQPVDLAGWRQAIERALLLTERPALRCYLESVLASRID